jgi:hypothetical protein
MSKLAQKPDHRLDAEAGISGLNLVVIYALLALGILAAMAFAAMVVWPFYQRK